MKMPPFAASTRPKLASGCGDAMKPLAPSAVAPRMANHQGRFSLTDCQISHAPPISAAVAETKRTVIRSMIIQRLSQATRRDRWSGLGEGDA